MYSASRLSSGLRRRETVTYTKNLSLPPLIASWLVVRSSHPSRAPSKTLLRELVQDRVESVPPTTRKQPPRDHKPSPYSPFVIRLTLPLEDARSSTSTKCGRPRLGRRKQKEESRCFLASPGYQSGYSTSAHAFLRTYLAPSA
uniref:Uncharacterized protein n=1 Tax=Mycena chlorophos TaxID=658473 RepID=A0ABQ0LBM9_MYCCL|nr:predicted protein [Mycena chlorophos]